MNANVTHDQHQQSAEMCYDTKLEAK